MSLEADIAVQRGDFFLKAALSVEAGGVTALFGPSGSGKSTIVHALAGLVGDAQGFIRLGGRLLLDTKAGVRVPPPRRRIGVVFQDGRLFPHLDVEANLRFGARRAPEGAAATASFEEIVALLGIERLLKRRPATLSGGERQRVALGRAILSRPELLLLDEPLSALDQARREDVLPFFESLRGMRGLRIVYVSHAVEEVARLADRVVALKDGRIVADGPVSDVLGRAGPGEAGFEPVSVLTARVLDASPTDGLIDLALGAERLVAPAFAAREGEQARVRIAARDVMIALTRPEGVSANNVLACTVDRIDSGPAAVTVRLTCQGQAIVAEITRRAFDRLGLREGMEAFAVVKTVTIAH